MISMSEIQIGSFLQITLWLIVLTILFKVYDKLVDFGKTRKDFTFPNPKVEAFWSFVVICSIFGLVLLFSHGMSGQGTGQRHFSLGGAAWQFFVIIIVLIPLWAALGTRNQSFRSLGFHRHNLLKSSGLVILFFVSKILFEVIGHQKRLSFRTEYFWGVLQYLSVGFGEETLFRGYFQTHLGNWIGKWKGCLVASVIFALFHLPHRLIVESLSLGDALLVSLFALPLPLFLGWVFMLTKNITAPALIHALIEEPLDPFLFQ